MAIANNIKQPINWYTTAAQRSTEKTRYKDAIRGTYVLVDKLKLFPFTLKKTSAIEDNLTVVTLINLKTGVSTDITSYLTSDLITDYTTSTGYITYPATSNLSTPLTEGYYRLTATDGTNTWYSDDFIVVNLATRKHVTFQYYSDFDKFSFIYQYGFKNQFHFYTIVSNHTENIVFDKTFENENGIVFDVKRYIIPLYSIKMICRKELLDAINLMKIHENIEITDELGYTATVRIDDVQFQQIEKTDLYRVNVIFRESNESDVNVIGDNTNEDNITIARVYVDENGDTYVDEDGNSYIY